MPPIHPAGDPFSVELTPPGLTPPHHSPSSSSSADPPPSTFNDVLSLLFFQFSIVVFMLIVVATVVSGLLMSLHMARRSAYGQGPDNDGNDGGGAEALFRARFGTDEDGFALGMGTDTGMGLGLGLGQGLGQGLGRGFGRELPPGLEGREIWVQGPPPYVEGQEPPSYEEPPEYEE